MSEQGTPEWFQSRVGKVTASRVSDLMAKTKSGYSASRENYMAQLIVELISGEKAESFNSPAMQWGTDTEPLARAAYEVEKDVLVDEVGFILHPTIEGAGASPDGQVGDEGLIEIKCPNTATALDAWLKAAEGKNPVPAKYNAQMQMQMACTGRQWCDYVVFDPRMPHKAQLLIYRVERDESFIQEMEAEITKFIDEMNEKVLKLNNLFKE